MPLPTSRQSNALTPATKCGPSCGGDRPILLPLAGLSTRAPSHLVRTAMPTREQQATAEMTVTSRNLHSKPIGLMSEQKMVFPEKRRLSYDCENI
jgi:hypothetical protein